MPTPRNTAAVGVIAPFRRAGWAAEERGKGGEAGANDADVEFDRRDDEDGDHVPDIVPGPDQDDAVVEGDDRAEASAEDARV